MIVNGETAAVGDYDPDGPKQNRCHRWQNQCISGECIGNLDAIDSARPRVLSLGANQLAGGILTHGLGQIS